MDSATDARQVLDVQQTSACLLMLVHDGALQLAKQMVLPFQSSFDNDVGYLCK